jgi:hypothetical protein
VEEIRIFQDLYTFVGLLSRPDPGRPVRPVPPEGLPGMNRPAAESPSMTAAVAKNASEADPVTPPQGLREA